MGLQTFYYANSLQNLVMKTCAYLLQISNFEYNARSVPVIVEHSDFYPSVFTPIHILFKVLQHCLRKKRSFDTSYCIYNYDLICFGAVVDLYLRITLTNGIMKLEI